LAARQYASINARSLSDSAFAIIASCGSHVTGWNLPVPCVRIY
jgi:hypothetical protein